MSRSASRSTSSKSNYAYNEESEIESLPEKLWLETGGRKEEAA